MNRTSRNQVVTVDQKEIIKRQLLRNIQQDFVKCFKRYRELVNNKDSKIFRKSFYNVLKAEILKSLDYNEKKNIILAIQEEFYSPNSYSTEVTDTLSQSYSSEYSNTVSDNNFMNSMNINTGWPIGVFPTKDISDQNFVDNMDERLNYEYFTPRCFTPRSTADTNNEFPLSTADTNNEFPLIEKFEDEDHDSNDEDLVLVNKMFSELTITIEKDEDVIEKFKNLKTDHGDEMLKRIISHVPQNQTRSTPNLEPIMFQMACKIDRYESAIDQLHKDHLFNLNQQNQYQMTVYNVLLIKDFELFQRFLSYLNERKFEIGIRYFIQTTAEGDEINMVVNSTGSTPKVFIYPIKTNKKDTIQLINEYNPAEKRLIYNGILYCRGLLKESSQIKPLTIAEKQAFVKELDSINILGVVLNEPVGNEKSYTAELAKTYPNSETIIKLVVDRNPAALLDSPFFILLAERAIESFYQCLQYLIKLRLDKTLLCQMCLKENEEGKSLVSVIESKTCANNQKTVKFIREFIDAYRSQK